MERTPGSGLLKLRPLDIRPLVQDGQPLFMLRDPLQLAEHYVLVSQYIGPALMLLDGTRDLAELRVEVAGLFGRRFADEALEQIMHTLDNALLLDNVRYAGVRASVLNDYRQAPFRPPMLAGRGYPEDPHALRVALDAYLDDAADVEISLPSSRGLFSPHIDYARGGIVYAQVWKSAAQIAREADLVVLLATDHYGDMPFTLTRQNYASPYGILPTEQGVIDVLAEAIGMEAAFAGELCHRVEHSVELVATWLHHMRRGQPVALVPILCGSFGRFVRGMDQPDADRQIAALVDALHYATSGRKVAVVVSGDLSHVGLAFGGDPLDAAAEQRLQSADACVIAQLCAGDAEGFFGAIKHAGDRNNVCGLPPGYLALRLLGGARGELLGYERCPVDEADTSAVTVCGVVWS